MKQGYKIDSTYVQNAKFITVTNYHYLNEVVNYYSSFYPYIPMNRDLVVAIFKIKWKS